MFFFMRSSLSAEEFGLRLSTELLASGNWIAGSRLSTQNLRGEMHWNVDPDQYQSAQLRSFSARVRISENTAVYAGAQILSGAPARAMNPVRALSSAFTHGTRIQRAPVFSPGEGLDYHRLSLESSLNSLRLAGSFNPWAVRDGPLWGSVSLTSPRHKTGKLEATAAFFSGMNTLPADSAESWYSPEQNFPERTGNLSGLEYILQGPNFSQHGALYLSLREFQIPVFAVRADTELNFGSFGVTAGLYESTGRLRTLLSSSTRIISREFIAPRLSFGGGKNHSGLTLRTAVLAEHSIFLPEGFNALYEERWRFLGDIRIVTEKLAAEGSVMHLLSALDTETDYSLTLELPLLPQRRFKLCGSMVQSFGHDFKPEKQIYTEKLQLKLESMLQAELSACQVHTCSNESTKNELRISSQITLKNPKIRISLSNELTIPLPQSGKVGYTLSLILSYP